MKISALLIVSVLSVLVVGLCVGIEPHTTPVGNVDIVATMGNDTMAQIFYLGPNNYGTNGTSTILISGEHDLEFKGHKFPVNKSGEFILIDRVNNTVFIRADGYSDKYFIGKGANNMEFVLHLRGNIQIAVPDEDAMPTATFPEWFKKVQLVVDLQNDTVTVNVPTN